jgi:hypothetical protein
MSFQYFRISPLHWNYNVIFYLSQSIKVFLKFSKLSYDFILKLLKQPTYPLRQVMMNNTSPFRITATAGTKLVRAYSYITIKFIIYKRVLQLYASYHSHDNAGSNFRPLSNILHCSPSRKLGLISVPMWLINLSI